MIFPSAVRCTAGAMMFTLCAMIAPANASARATEPPRLFPQLSLARTQLAFSHAGDIWVVPRGGGTATQLTSGPEDDSYPSFSPDGAQIAFSRAIAGDADVYVMAAPGGSPTRLTFHPAAELVRGWSPDGDAILFTAARAMGWQSRLYTVRAGGGPSRELAIPIAWNGVFAPDGRIVYSPREVIGRYPTSWRGYRGGSMGSLELADLTAGTFTPLSSRQGNDRLPVWAGNRLLIASDRVNGLYEIHSLDLGSTQAIRITHSTGTGIGALAGSPDGMAAYERNGEIFLLDPTTGRSEPVPISLAANRDEMAEREVPAGEFIDSVSVGSGGEVAIAARGEVLLLGAQNEVRNFTATSFASEQAPAFSFDGRRLAYISFGEGGDCLILETLAPEPSRRTIALPAGRGGYFEPRWSPDALHLTVTDLRGGLWLVDSQTGSARQIDRATHMADYSFEVSWSSDGGWFAYSRYLPNNNRALFLQRAIGDENYQLTSGQVDAGSPNFGPDGRLYFLSSGNAAVAEAFGMYPAVLRPTILRRIQAVSLDLRPSPAELRRSLSETAFAQRVRTLPFPARDYGTIAALADGTLLSSARQWPATPGSGDSTIALYRLDPQAPEGGEPIATDVSQFAVSANHDRLLINSGNNWSVRPLPTGAEGSSFSLEDVRLTINPPQEWRQIYREAWRGMRDLFYDPAYHGQDVAALEERYAHYLPGITRRADLTALLYLALGNVSVSHIALDGGTGLPLPARPASGLLGLDFVVEGNRFRVSRVYAGAPYAAEAIVAGPLDGVDPPFGTGMYLLRINGVEVTTDRDIHYYLLGAAGQPTTLTIAERPNGRGARTLTVSPLATDAALREAAWINGNRELVERRSNGTIAYVYIPDFQERGMAAFLRQWTAASDMDGVVLDQRYNPGGWGADFMLDLVQRRPIYSYMFRDARDLAFPVISNRGPRALIVNERNGSAADTFPWSFQRAGIGPIVGHQTAGWGVGHIWRMTFVDGSGMSLPLRAFFNPEGTWDIENRGVMPDIPVEMDPAAALRGEDAQLNAAIDAVVRLRMEHPTEPPRHPPPLVYEPQGNP